MGGGGAERQLAYLAAGLVSADVDTHVALTRGGENGERLSRSGAVVHEIAIRHNRSPKLPVAMHRLIRDLRPTIVHTWLTQMDIAGGAAAVVNVVPWIITENNSPDGYSGRPTDRIRLLLGRRAAALVANSATGMRYWDQHLSPCTERHVIANGLPLDEIKSCPAVNPLELPLRTGEKLILFAGRLRSSKNVHNLVAALRLLRGRARFKAVLCGQGPLREQLEHFIRSAGMAEQILLKGYAHDLWSWMKRADVFVSVSFREGQPNTVMEAMAAGCPLVASDIAGHREILDESVSRLVDPSDPSRIAEVLAEVLHGDSGCRTRKEAAALRAEQWSVEVMVRRYLALYMRIARQPGPTLLRRTIRVHSGGREREG
jgi:glycosyltransferase involved in cell wall biosynthesis